MTTIKGQDMSEIPTTDLVNPLLVLAKFNIPTDIQDLLISGNAMRGVPSGALQATLLAEREAATKAEREACALIALSFVRYFVRYGGDSEHGITINPFANAQNIATAIRSGARP